MESLSGVDLNLLVALGALLDERSVTRAAQRVGLSQPAMSAALGRLREALHDPLLVRGPHGMVPTPRAEELQVPVREILSRIDATFHPPPPFDPATTRRAFTLLTADYGELLLLPNLMGRLALSAPGMDIGVRPWSGSHPWEELAEGRADLALSIHTEAPAGLYRQVLARESFVCLARAAHPRIQGKLTLELYTELPHLLISPSGGPTGTVDPVLASQGLKRRIALRVPHFLVAPQVIARTDLLLTLPARVAAAFVDTLPLQILTPPIPLPEFTLSQFWHERSHQDPAHAFLRAQIMETCRSG